LLHLSIYKQKQNDNIIYSLFLILDMDLLLIVIDSN